jgi:hypothetical protein
MTFVCNRLVILGCVAGFLFIVSARDASGQVTPGPGARGAATAPARPTFTQRRNTLENQLRSTNKSIVDQAFAAYKAWFSEDPKVAENAFWYARPAMMPLTDHASQTLELIEL